MTEPFDDRLCVPATASRCSMEQPTGIGGSSPDPDQFDIDRRPKGHLGFGMGKHFCIGSHFARMVTEVAMNRFLERVPDYELQQDGFEWLSSSNLRSPMTLPFRIG